MKARDLIKELEKLDPEAEIGACYCRYCEGEDVKTIAVQSFDFEGIDYIVTGTYL